MPGRTDLPDHVRQLVAEIETEIGEEQMQASAIEGRYAGDHRDANHRVEAAVRQILAEIGEDPDRAGLVGTPERVHRMYTELTAGYHVDPDRLTQQIADFLMDRLHPKGVGVVLEATHLCAVMRGVRKPGTVMTTSAVLGIFRANDKTRAEFFAHLGRPAPGA